ncbi:MAG TPA: aspartate aminotransferase family protein [Parvibaculum sp.]|jgi:beta-alanine--pyruvate transaminase
MSADTAAGIATPNDLESNWLPFTPNRQFKREPRMLTRAKDIYYYKPDGTEVLDATAGLWCCNAGHCRDDIVKAIQTQAGELDFAPSFQFGHPKAFELASRVASLMPGDLDHVLFCNSGSEADDTALKIAIAYHRANGEASRTRLIGRERAYHGVGFGGISVGGMVANRKFFGPMLAGVDHLPHTYNRAEQAFTIGQPQWGAHLADELQRLVELHDASTIAAVIVEPMSGSTGVLPPPVGYLQRLRELCTKHGILLIFDEVITGFGRLGYATAAERFGVTPDILTFAKGITSGTVPLGGAVVRKHIYDIFQTGPDHLIDLFHGYTYSGHPLATAAGIATLDLYRKENLFERAQALEPVFAEALMSLKGHKLIADIRCIGLAGAIDLVPIDGLPGKRGFDAMRAAFHEENMMVRVSGDTIAFSPPLIIDKAKIEEIFGRFRRVLDKAA